MCHVVRRASSVKSDKGEIASILALFYCLKPLTDENLELNQEPEKKRTPGYGPGLAPLNMQTHWLDYALIVPKKEEWK